MLTSKPFSGCPLIYILSALFLYHFHHINMYSNCLLLVYSNISDGQIYFWKAQYIANKQKINRQRFKKYILFLILFETSIKILTVNSSLLSLPSNKVLLLYEWINCYIQYKVSLYIRMVIIWYLLLFLYQIKETHISIL